MALPTVTAIGNMVADAEVTTTTNGHIKAQLRMACNDRKKVNGEWVDGDTLFVSVTCWDGKAEAVAELRKGQAIIVTGRINVREYEKKDGTKGHSTEINAENVAVMLKAPRTSPTSSNDDAWAF